MFRHYDHGVIYTLSYRVATATVCSEDELNKAMRECSNEFLVCRVDSIG